MSSVDVFLKNTSAVLPNSSRDTKRSKLFRYFRPDYLTALMSGQKSGKVFYGPLCFFASLSCDVGCLDGDGSEELKSQSELYIIAFSLQQTDSSSAHSTTRYYCEGTTRACCYLIHTLMHNNKQMHRLVHMLYTTYSD